MATQGTVTAGSIYDNSYLGAKTYRIPFTAVSDDETFTSNIGSILDVRWASTDSGDHVAVEVTTQATGVVTFTTSGSTSHAGDLIIVCRGY